MKTLATLLLALVALSATAFGQAEEMGDEAKQLVQSARTKIQARDIQGALDDYVKARELEPKVRSLWMMCGQLRSALNDHEGAVKDFTEAIELNDSDPRGFVLRGGAKQRLKDAEGALKDFDSAVSLSDGDPMIHRIRGLAHQAQKDYDAADKDFTAAIKKNEKYADAFLARARLRELTGDLQGAENDFSSVCSLAPEYSPAYVSRAEVKAAQGKFKPALEDYDNALFLVQGDAKANILISRARVRLLSGDTAGSEGDFKAAVEMLPGNHQVLFSRGLWHYDMQRHKEAVADFRKSLELDANAHEYGRLYICLARMQLGEKDAAQKELGEYLDGREDKTDWFTKVAGFLAGRITEEAFIKATEDKNPYTTREQACEAYWYAGAVALIAGDKAKALQNMGVCVAFNVHNFIEYQSSKAVLMRENPPTKTETPKTPDK